MRLAIAVGMGRIFGLFHNRYLDHYLTRYPASDLIFCQLSGFRPDILPDILNEAVFKIQYPASAGYPASEVSDISRVWLDIRYPAH